MDIPKELGIIVIKFHFEQLRNGLLQEEKERKLRQFEGFLN